MQKIVWSSKAIAIRPEAKNLNKPEAIKFHCLVWAIFQHLK